MKTTKTIIVAILLSICHGGVALAETGTVAWFNKSKGYGQIKRSSPDEKPLFVHRSALKGVSSLEEGQVVEYDVIVKDGSRSAGNVKLK